jgi:hypothetical protein
MTDPEKPLKIPLWRKTKEWVSKIFKFIIIYVKFEIAHIRSIPLMKVLGGTWKYLISTIVAPLYPIAIFLVLLYCLTSPSQGGAIRKAEATQDHPTIVRLAKGRRTAIHFWAKPEKVIAGSPGKVQIDFLGNDVTVSPLANDPGNLLVYARGTRFVILFQMTSELAYDDVVQLVPGRSKEIRAIRLDQDTYHLATFKLVRQQSGAKTETQIQVLLKDAGKVAVIEDLGDLVHVKAIKCGRCVYSREDTTLVCPTPIEKVDCHGSGALKLSLVRVPE